jgi:predicted amidohydrolase
MKVALAQIDPHPVDVDANMVVHRELIHEAVRERADLIVFPELSLTGDKLGPFIKDVSLTLESDPLVEICGLSQQIDIVVGLVERGVNLYDRFNSAFYFSQGALIHRHRKLFLVNYAVFEEGKHYVAGNNLQAFDTHLGRACMLICNDPWHAAMPYIAALDGAETLIVPANSARGTLKQYLDIASTWEQMNRAYSATMGFYTVFVNRVGKRKDAHGEFPYWGGSEIIGPRGEVVVKAPYDEEALVYGEVDLERVAEQRYQAPLIRDARLWIVQQEIERLAAKRSSAVELEEDALPLPPGETETDPVDGENDVA